MISIMNDLQTVTVIQAAKINCNCFNFNGSWKFLLFNGQFRLSLNETVTGTFCPITYAPTVNK
jgi:hypothetical protein